MKSTPKPAKVPKLPYHLRYEAAILVERLAYQKQVIQKAKLNAKEISETLAALRKQARKGGGKNQID